MDQYDVGANGQGTSPRQTTIGQERSLAQAVAPELAYFSLTTIVSLVCVMKHGESVVIAVVGNDAMLGVTSFAH